MPQAFTRPQASVSPALPASPAPASPELPEPTIPQASAHSTASSTSTASPASAMPSTASCTSAVSCVSAASQASSLSTSTRPAAMTVYGYHTADNPDPDVLQATHGRQKRSSDTADTEACTRRLRSRANLNAVADKDTSDDVRKGNGRKGKNKQKN